MIQEIDDVLSGTHTYRSKSGATRRLIAEALHILQALGIPVEDTPRRLERMAMAFLAVANINRLHQWQHIRSRIESHHMKTRDIIDFINQHLEEDISSGSYDDIRRKDLKLTVAADVVLQTAPGTARNNPNRAYMLSPVFADVIQHYQTKNWQPVLQNFLQDRSTLVEELSAQRQINRLPVTIPSGKTIEFSPGKHNQLQKLIIEDFLPRYGYGAQVLYVGDAADKFLLLEADALNALNFFELNHGELPDVIIAYSTTRNWLYLIEAVHSSGAITPLRLRKLANLTDTCTADIIYVTAFLDRKTFRKFVADIAWETEVWIAEDPDHLIHFNGEKFLGPYS